MTDFKHIAKPDFGEPIRKSAEGLQVPSQPIIPIPTIPTLSIVFHFLH